ncbi:MAG: amidase domain-containing protein [Ruminococcus sp.]|jgi:hypothetical protein|nr:amidase domain-containing protein [Ruminococcus sp.]
MEYNRAAVVSYADRWALSRNPRYFDFENFGGDCTNFVSQSVYAGWGVMNYTRTFGWYYNSSFDRAPAWSGVNEFYNFLLRKNRELKDQSGPLGIDTTYEKLELGDIAQLNAEGVRFTHTLIVTAFDVDGAPLFSTHSMDSHNRRLESWEYKEVRFIHIV